MSDGGPTAAGELTGAAEAGALVSCVLAGVDGAAPTRLRWLEQPAAVTASPTIIVVITVTDVVRIMLYRPTLYRPAGFTFSAAHPTFIVNRRPRPHESLGVMHPTFPGPRTRMFEPDSRLSARIVGVN
jgi:hypothetical protein